MPIPQDKLNGKGTMTAGHEREAEELSLLCEMEDATVSGPLLLEHCRVL